MKAKSQRFLAILGALAFALWNALPASAQALPPTLTGESFFTTTISSVTATCNPAGTSMISYTVSGPAFGPYPGTFTETGTVDIGPETLPQFVNGFEVGPITSFQASFTIDSVVGDVHGTKQLLMQSPNAFGACYDFTNRTLPGGPTVSGTFREFCACALSLTYSATIGTFTGLFRDEGRTGAILDQFNATIVGGGSIHESVFNEVFVSSLFVPIPLPSTPGKATGGGQIPSPSGADTVTLGFTAQSDVQGQKGACEVVDHGTGTKIKCLDVTAYFQSGNQARFIGHATINGANTMYRIRVTETGEPGMGRDSFAIQTLSGYAAAGVLLRGNIQVHSGD